jgi:membrane-associated phospholipid phosphatase
MTTSKRVKKAAEAVMRVDAAAAKKLAPLDDAPWLERVSSLADQPQLRTLSVALIAAGLAAGRGSGYGPKLARAGLRMLIAHELATFAKNVVKRRIDRTRPRARTGSDHRPRPGRRTAKEVTSFPSGHAAGAAAPARALARELPGLAAPAGIVGGTLALLQLPRSAHYPTDTAAGLAIGLAAEAALAALWPAAASSANQRPIERELPPCAT